MSLFGTAGIRGRATDRVTPELALAVGRAVGEPGRTVVVGRDGRETGPALACAVEAGLASAGARVRRAGVVPTPVLAHASRGRWGVMLTASHNPPCDNGIKLFADGVEFDAAAEATVEAAIRDPNGEEGIPLGPNPAEWDEWTRPVNLAVCTSYRQSVLEYVRERFGGEAPLDGLSIAIDCATGVGASVAPTVLDRLGADVTALNDAVDGHFPARDSKPTPSSLSATGRFVADAPVDFGLALDGDADRLVVLDGDGDVVHEDTVLAIVAGHFVQESDVEDPVVVTTPNASGRIDEYVRGSGARIERVRLGALHEGIDRVRRAGGPGTRVVFAAEPWKHIYPDFGGWIDAILGGAVVSALVASEGGLEPLREPIAERPYRKVSVDCPDAGKDEAMQTVETILPTAFSDPAVETDYGVRIDLEDGSWVLVRPSGTEPYLRIYAESESVEDLIERSRSIVETAVSDAVGGLDH